MCNSPLDHDGAVRCLIGAYSAFLIKYRMQYDLPISYNREKHAKRRANQRYHVDLSPAQAVKIGQYVNDGRAERLGPNVYAIQLHEIDDRLPQRRAIIAFSKRRNEVQTFLPDDWTPEKAAARKAKRSPSHPVRIKSTLPPLTKPIDQMTMDELCARLEVLKGWDITNPTDNRKRSEETPKINKRMAHLNSLAHKKLKRSRYQDAQKVKAERFSAIIQQLHDSVR